MSFVEQTHDMRASELYYATAPAVEQHSSSGHATRQDLVVIALLLAADWP